MPQKKRVDSKAREKFILASAALHTQPPVNLSRVNCHKVLRHAMIAAGVWNKQLDDLRSAAFYTNEQNEHPGVKLWYSTLIGLTQHKPDSERLLEGGGNLILPADACFTACWLTPTGKLAAEQLLIEHPTWKPLLLQNDFATT